MPQRFTDRIIRVVGRDDYRPSTARSLAKIIKVKDEDMDIFDQAIAILTESKAININEKKLIVPPAPAKRVIGRFETTRRDFGFIRPETRTAAGDIFVPMSMALDAAHGDRVVARVSSRGQRDGKPRYVGEIVEVLERASRQSAGTLQREGKHWFVRPDGAKDNELISVDDPGAKNCKEGDKVSIEIMAYGDRDFFAHGVIIKKLGKSGSPSAELKSTLARFNIVDHFPKAALDDARKAVTGFDPQVEIDKGLREDLRNEIIVTIDPETARDFDDAISLKKLHNGHWLLGVHIADVSHFVKEGSKLDKEACERATSVYLPGYVVPMLPELLSNGLCSLQGQQDRFAKSAYIELGRNAEVIKTRFANSVIRSTQRMTYEDADRILEGVVDPELAPEAVALVKEMEKLARVIYHRREKAGQLRLDIPKPELIIDEHGKPVGARPESDTFSHTIIEMFMIEANEAVARLLDSLGVEFPRRIHPEPDSLTSGVMVQVLRQCGYDVPKNVDRFGLQKLLESVQGKPESKIINIAVLRSMQKAEYRAAHIGHYALASDYYCHFTSPIRRYPDLVVHRLFDEFVAGRLTKKTADKYPDFAAIDQLGIYCSEKERNAEAAENDLRDYMMLQLLVEKIGEDLPGMITTINNNGIFVELDNYMVSGFINEKAIKAYALAKINTKDKVKLKDKKSKDRKQMKNISRAPLTDNCPFKLGERVNVRIVNVNLPARDLEIDIVVQNDDSIKTVKEKSRKKS
ncbi:MAG: VacB/RNase II family 3'-5' exoribonuclease [Sedimentisphaerales bacterium]|nr:VacB/RNase II family 3'-5' exoribonuclease [Sedimentisphaerales bacterium]